ncbi:MAG TPA: discoidin domain-containing protein, partial [Lacibacter sp.]|nr:discoidin domain-containing protein [Lacibacter sp.]
IANKPLPKNGKFISLLKPVAASNTFTDKDNTYSASFVTDGNLDSRWMAADAFAEVVIDLNPAEAFNKISIFEYQDTKNLPDGFSQIRTGRIKQYSIDVLDNGEWKTIYLGTEPMGDCKVIKLPRNYKTSKLKLKITNASALPSIYELSVIRM